MRGYYIDEINPSIRAQQKDRLPLVEISGP